MTTIKAPFNFIPMSDEVYFPHWAKQISHDIPFPDGISGIIQYRFKALTPIFVKNGHGKEDGQNETTFCHNEKGYFIPGTSIKGEIRNTLEVMSFSKINIEKDMKFTKVRNVGGGSGIKNPNVKYELSSPNEQKKIRCGWLRKAPTDAPHPYVIVDCGEPYRIDLQEIIKLGAKSFEEYFYSDIPRKKCQNLNAHLTFNGEKIDPKTAYFKYTLCHHDQMIQKLYGQFFLFKGSEGAMGASRRSVCIDRSDHPESFRGDIVMTGQPGQAIKSPRPKERNQKHWEFVFERPYKESKRYYLSEEVYKTYQFIYQDCPTWKYWADENPSNPKSRDGIPVFFRVENKQIKDFGLTYMYKIPYENSIWNKLPSNHRSELPDLAECIFGYASNDDNGLKGRVQFSNAYTCNTPSELPITTLVLNNPKPSYTPLYAKHEFKNDWGMCTKPMDFNNSTIAGRKRYPVRSSIMKPTSKIDNESIVTLFRPLKEGVTFECIIRFHNLKPAELGALLSAITFHGNKDCKHQIGQAKPYGYGVVGQEDCILDLYRANENAPQSPNDYMKIFEDLMTKWCQEKNFRNSWLESRQLKELFAMASGDYAKLKPEYQGYMELNDNVKEFTEVRNAGTEALDLYSKLLDQQKIPYKKPSSIE